MSTNWPAHLDSAQVSLEAADPDIHDAIVGHPGAWRRTVQGIRNLKAAGIHVHTNTTINSLNRDHLLDLVEFLAEMEQPYLSMNMVIRTGDAVGSMEIGYRGDWGSGAAVEGTGQRARHEVRVVLAGAAVPVQPGGPRPGQPVLLGGRRPVEHRARWQRAALLQL